MNIKNMPLDERPVEKIFSAGVKSLSNAELIGVILGSGSRDKSAIGLSEDIISGGGGLSWLSNALPQELTDFNGVGQKKAARIVASVELGKRLAREAAPERITIDNSQDAAAFFMEDMRHLNKEHFRLLMMNVKSEIICTEEISVGGLSEVQVYPREVFSPAIKKSAAYVIMVHNHPSGNPDPSDEDLRLTARIKEAGDILGIGVLDHIIIGDGRYISLREEGYFID